GEDAAEVGAAVAVPVDHRARGWHAERVGEVAAAGAVGQHGDDAVGVAGAGGQRALDHGELARAVDGRAAEVAAAVAVPVDEPALAGPALLAGWQRRADDPIVDAGAGGQRAQDLVVPVIPRLAAAAAVVDARLAAQVALAVAVPVDPRG